MPSKEFSSVLELPRAEAAPAHANGHDDAERLPSLPSIKAGTNVEPGRAVDPKGPGSFASGLDAERRTYGRDKDFIGSIEAIADFDPQVSQAVWQFLRLMNPGHALVAYKGPRTKFPTKEDGPGQALLDTIVGEISEEYGGGNDQLHDVLSLMLVTHGAIAAELSITSDGNELEDFYPINPLRLDFKRFPVFEGDKIGKLKLCQKSRDGKYVLVNPNKVFYQGLDPAVDKPHGRPPLMASLQTVLSKSQLLNDLRAVAHNQGYPRIDVKVLWDVLQKAAPKTLRDGGRDNDLVGWMRKQLEQVATDYNALKVDDTFVHYDWIDIGMVGPNYAATSFDFKGLEQILTRQINSALKTLPILLGYNEAVSETHGSIQWQIQVAGLEALQKHVKRLMEKLYNATLRFYGIDAWARIEYTKHRTTDRKFEAESAFLEAKTRQVYQQQGWEDGDAIAQELFGHDAVGEPIIPGATGKDPGGQPGADPEKNVDKTKEAPTLIDVVLT